MPWTEEQKRMGRLELHRRSRTETALSRRMAFLKAGFAAIGAALLSCALVWSALHVPETYLRVEATIAALLTLTVTLVASLLAYVRFQDWHRGLAHRDTDIASRKAS